MADARDSGEVRITVPGSGSGYFGSLVAMPSLLSKVIKSQGQDAEISSIMDWVQEGTSDEGWAIHTDGSL